MTAQARKGRARSPPGHWRKPRQLRSARAARSVVVLPVLPEAVLPDEPMVLPLLGVSEEVPLLAAGALEELELLLGDDGVLEDEADEPLAPIEVPLLLGDDELEELVDGAEPLVLVSLLLVPEVAGAVLDPEAPMLLVDRSLVLGPAAAPGPLALEPDELLPVAPAVPLPAVCANATPPNASAAAAARLVRVILVALMLNS